MPVVAGLVAGSAPSALQLAGIAVAVVGVVLASGPELGGGAAGVRCRWSSPSSPRSASAGCSSSSPRPARAAARGEVVLVLLVMRLVSVLAVTALLLGRVARTGRAGWESGVRRRDLPVLVVVGAFDVGANGAFAVASQGDLVSVTAVLASLYPVVTVLLARQVPRRAARGRAARRGRAGPRGRGAAGLGLTGVGLGRDGQLELEPRRPTGR